MAYLCEELSDVCSETWPMKELKIEHELKLNCSCIEMCEVKLNERKKSEEYRELLKLEPVRLW